jgi:preprotein translocase subunit SecD
MIALFAVAIFMVVYYRGSGMVANVALALNIVLILAALAGFGATLTLPGIAGLILTVGMAVDANVLVFERIREELELGKSVRAAIQAGYSRAFVTILDAQITTLIAAAVLFQFGTGPIKGFAVVLTIGIVSSIFTAVFVTHTIYESWMRTRPAKELSI